jgi:hypothetical protein
MVGHLGVGLKPLILSERGGGFSHVSLERRGLYLDRRGMKPHILGKKRDRLVPDILRKKGDETIYPWKKEEWIGA